jgi:tRNA (guanine-N7-)-methyltransferase
MKRLKDLQIPFAWEERKAIVHDRLWYLPEKRDFSHFAFPGWQSSELFANDNPIHIEYCSGNGSWLIEKAKNEPHHHFLAVERQFERARKIWCKLHNANLSNVVVAWAEGHMLTQHFIPSNSVSEIYINFPDPWPKRRHAKYRIVQAPFVQELARILKPGGKLTIVTDHVGYSSIIIKELLAQPLLQSQFPAPYFVEATSEYGSSFFDELFRSQGTFIRLHQFFRL